MMIVAGGVFFAVSVLCLMVGSFAVIEKGKFEKALATSEKELEGQDALTRQLSQKFGLDRTINKFILEALQNSIAGSFTMAGITGALTVGCAIAGSSKTGDKLDQ